MSTPDADAAREQARRKPGQPGAGQFGTQPLAEAAVSLTHDSATAHDMSAHGTGRPTDCICNYGPDTEGPDECCPHHGRPEYRAAAQPRPVPVVSQQTEKPLTRLPLHSTGGTARGLARDATDGDIDLTPPYQRGSVWGLAQRENLIRSMRMGLPIPPVVLNDRHTPAWYEANGTSRETMSGPTYAVIDGKQRLETVAAWFNGDLAVPASWFPADEIESPRPSIDGPYVTWNDLTPVARTRMSTEATLPRIYAQVATVEEEAEIYVLLNAGGTEQTAADMDNARRVARRD